MEISSEVSIYRSSIKKKKGNTTEPHNKPQAARFDEVSVQNIYSPYQLLLAESSFKVLGSVDENRKLRQGQVGAVPIYKRPAGSWKQEWPVLNLSGTVGLGFGLVGWLAFPQQLCQKVQTVVVSTPLCH